MLLTYTPRTFIPTDRSAKDKICVDRVFYSTIIPPLDSEYLSIAVHASTYSDYEDSMRNLLNGHHDWIRRSSET
jgi:hypothetical protein